MSSIAQNEIVQTLIDNNTQAAQQWLEDARLRAQAGDEDARALVALTETDEGKRALWAATCHIDLAMKQPGRLRPRVNRLCSLLDAAERAAVILPHA